MRVRLTKEQFEAFKNSQLTLPNHYQDWQAWLESKSFYDEISEDDINALNYYEPALTVNDYLE